MERRGVFRVVLGLLVGIALLFAITRVIDATQGLNEFSQYNWSYMPWVLALSAIYFLFKGLRWHYYLSVAGIHLPLRKTLLVYLAGQWFAFTPAGEFVRVYLLAPYKVSFAQASPTLVVHLLVDFLSLAILGSVVVLWYGDLAFLVLPLTLAIIFGVLLIVNPWLKAFVGRQAFLRPVFNRLGQTFNHSSNQLLTARQVAIGTAMGVPTMMVGALALYLVCQGTASVRASGIDSILVFSLSQLAGALSMLPHGLGAVEGSSLGLFAYAGIDSAGAMAVVALFRLATLVWGVALGGIALLALNVAPVYRMLVGGAKSR